MYSHPQSRRIRLLTYGALTASLYIVLTYISTALGLSGGIIQLRFSEVLTILPALLPLSVAPAAVWGLFSGCLLANMLTGAMLWDTVFGSIATLLGAIGTLYLRKTPRVAWLPPVLTNTVIVPWILRTFYAVGDAVWFLCLTVAVGEAITAGLGGTIIRRLYHRRLKTLIR